MSSIHPAPKTLADVDIHRETRRRQTQQLNDPVYETNVPEPTVPITAEQMDTTEDDDTMSYFAKLANED